MTASVSRVDPYCHSKSIIRKYTGSNHHVSKSPANIKTPSKNEKKVHLKQYEVNTTSLKPLWQMKGYYFLSIAFFPASKAIDPDSFPLWRAKCTSDSAVKLHERLSINVGYETHL